jgi:hypothetical protein
MATTMDIVKAAHVKFLNSAHRPEVGTGIVGKFAWSLNGTVYGKMNKNVYAFLIVMCQRLKSVCLHHPLFSTNLLNTSQGSVTLPKNSNEWRDYKEGLTDSIVTSIRNVHHWIFDCVVSISPVMLFVSHCPNKNLSASNMLRFMKALGCQRPAELFDVEAQLWRRALELIDNPGLLDKSPTTWFSIPPSHPTGSIFFGRQIIPSVPGLVSFSSVKEREDLALTEIPRQTDIFDDVDKHGTLSPYTTY